MPTYVLPDLPYDYSALEPHISAEVMRVHHEKHHGNYVKKANEYLEKLGEARVKGDVTQLGALEMTLAFHVSGHVLHSLFWRNLMPKGDARPQGSLLTAIDRDFGGFDHFKREMIATAESILGSGWAALMWEPMGQRLVINQIHDHQSETSQGSLPVMVLDAWEHAYYLQYRTEKTKFFEAIWNCWNWSDIASRLDAVKQVALLTPSAPAKAARGPTRSQAPN